MDSMGALFKSRENRCAYPRVHSHLARWHTARIRSSYSELEQGQGNSTAYSGRLTRSAWDSTRARRTACMATRFASLLNVVTNAAT